MDCGVLYVVSGDKYVEEATASAKSVKRNVDNVGITIATDHTSVDRSIFDQKIDLPNVYPHTGISTITPELIPYERTLFLDSDTYVTDDLHDLFKVLDNHDMAFTLSPGRSQVSGLPDPCVEFNTGVIAYKKSSSTRKLLEKWKQIHEEMLEGDGKGRNQPSFTKAIYSSDIDYMILPREYNCRVPRYGYLVHDVKILHGRTNESLKKTSEYLNSTVERRVQYTKLNYRFEKQIKLRKRSDDKMKLVQRAKWKYEEDGVISLIKTGINKLL